MLRAASFTALNLETAVTSRGRPQPKTYHFRTTPVAFTALRDAGVDLVTMANNHVLDYGQVGLADTLAAARAARFPYVGIGTSAAAAWAPYVTTINGVKIAVVGVSQVTELASSWVATRSRPGEANAINLPRTLAAVRAARRLAPVVIVFMHWGTEGQACPDPNQLSRALKWRRRGPASSSGPTRTCCRDPAGWGTRSWPTGWATSCGGSAPIAPPPGCWNSRCIRTRRSTTRFIPAVVSRTGQPVVLRGARARRAAAHYASLRACTQLTRRPS